MSRIIIAMLTVLFALTSGLAQGNKIAGVWKVVEVKTSGPNAETISDLQPSIYIFTKKHYSIMYVSGKSARPVPADLSALTAAELKSIFVDSFVANAGTFELKGDKLTTRPMVAKSPGFMEPGNFSTSVLKFDGNFAFLTADSNRNGAVTNPSTVKLLRIE